MTINNLHLYTESNIKMDNPARLIRRLCKHWAHKLTVECSEASGVTEGRVEFEKGLLLLTEHPDYLAVHLSAMSDEDLEILKEVFIRHAERMVPDETLEFTWA